MGGRERDRDVAAWGMSKKERRGERGREIMRESDGEGEVYPDRVREIDIEERGRDGERNIYI